MNLPTVLSYPDWVSQQATPLYFTEIFFECPVCNAEDFMDDCVCKACGGAGEIELTPDNARTIFTEAKYLAQVRADLEALSEFQGLPKQALWEQWQTRHEIPMVA